MFPLSFQTVIVKDTNGIGTDYNVKGNWLSTDPWWEVTVTISESYFAGNAGTIWKVDSPPKYKLTDRRMRSDDSVYRLFLKQCGVDSVAERENVNDFTEILVGNSFENPEFSFQDIVRVAHEVAAIPRSEQTMGDETPKVVAQRITKSGTN